MRLLSGGDEPNVREFLIRTVEMFVRILPLILSICCTLFCLIKSTVPILNSVDHSSQALYSVTHRLSIYDGVFDGVRDLRGQIRQCDAVVRRGPRLKLTSLSQQKKSSREE